MEMSPFQNGSEMDSAGWGAKWESQNGNSPILHNEMEIAKMGMNPFQNGNGMYSASWDAKMEIANCKWVHFPILHSYF